MTFPIWIESYHKDVDSILEKYCFTVLDSKPSSTPYLSYRHPCLSFHQGKTAFCVDLTKAPYRMPHYSTKEHGLLKAIKPLKNPVIVDMTAGVLKDSMLCTMIADRVISIESNPVIAALSENGLKRSPHDSIHFIYGRSEELLNQYPCDVVLIDPMFEDKKENSASKKPLQVIQSMVTKEDYTQLLDAAIKHTCKKIIIKRHAKDKPLTDTISHSIKSYKGHVRFDIIAQ